MLFTNFVRQLPYAALLLAASPITASPTNCASDKLSSFTTTDGTKYAYTYTPPEGDNATYMLIHGYPASHNDWAPQIANLTGEGYGVFAADNLGFGQTDMPTTPQAYRGKRIAGHLVELLDHEEIKTVVGVGHDWGSAVLSRLAIHHQDRFEKLVWLAVGHSAPGGLFDVDALNQAGLENWGYSPFSYWYFFDRYDAGKVIADHLESTYSLVYPVNHTLWIPTLGKLGGVRTWLTTNTTTAEQASYVSAAHKQDWLSWMSRPNATEAGLSTYRSNLRGINDADEAELTEEDWKLKVPVMTVVAKEDYVARPEFMASTEEWAVAGYRAEALDGGHWLSLEKADEINALLLDFVRS